MNLVAVAIVLALFLATRQQNSRLLIGLNRILFCLNNSSNTKYIAIQYQVYIQYIYKYIYSTKYIAMENSKDPQLRNSLQEKNSLLGFL